MRDQAGCDKGTTQSSHPACKQIMTEYLVQVSPRTCFFCDPISDI